MIDFLRRLWKFMRPYQTRLVLGLICGVLFAVTSGALYVVVRDVVNLVFETKAPTTPNKPFARVPESLRPTVERVAAHLPNFGHTSQNGLILIILSIPIIMFLRSLFNYLNIYLVNWASTRAIADLRTEAFAHLQTLPMGFYNQNNTGELISRVNHETQSLRNIVGTALASIITDPITIIFLLILLISQQPMLTLFSIIVLPACIVPITIYGRKVRRSARAMQGHAADLSKLMHESFTGTRIVKAYNLEGAVIAQFRQVTKKFISHSMRVVRANEIPGALIEFFGAIGVTLILLYVVMHKNQPAGGFSGPSLDAGSFIGFMASVFMMYKPIKSLTKLHNQLLTAQASSRRVFELLDTESTIVDPSSPVPLHAANADIHFDNVHFSYDHKPVLCGINLKVKAGQLVALVGSSGSGKTTLVNLLPRFFDPVSGTVRIGNTDIRDVAIKDLRRQMALVTQETILFHETIRQNIALGRPEASNAEIEAAARYANAHNFITQRPEGYETIVGEKGIMLSGGQRQRISIARAILKDAPILILDEATNALDAESERYVQAELEKLMENRTTICIAHRLSTIQKADLIVVLAEGRIVETGTHAELLTGGGVYKRLYEISMGQ